jgi:SOS response regulatory protein OraA/RecX
METDRSALQVALARLKKADRSTRELREYLQDKGFAQGDIDGAIQHLIQLGYLDDSRLAEAVIQQARQQKRGALATQRSLAKRQLEAPALSGDQTELALSALQSKFKPEPKEIPRAARFLTNRGFEEETIESAIARFFPDLM